jgi:hypothetical protein
LSFLRDLACCSQDFPDRPTPSFVRGCPPSDMGRIIRATPGHLHRTSAHRCEERGWTIHGDVVALLIENGDASLIS